MLADCGQKESYLDWNGSALFLLIQTISWNLCVSVGGHQMIKKAFLSVELVHKNIIIPADAL